MISLKTAAELGLMRVAGKIVAEVLHGMQARVKPGVSTAELDRWAEQLIVGRKAVPAFKGYRGFPATLCTSLNGEVVHGIPSAARVLKDGDIVSVDVGVRYREWYADAAWTYPVGAITAEAERLLKVTRESLELGIAQALPGKRLMDIGHAVQTHVEEAGFSVVRDFVGHGIGRELHEDPQIPNFGNAGQGVKLKAGMVLAIEPMVNAGGYEVRVLADGWTTVTQDGSLSAHFEHTVALLDGQAEVLTQ
ncbi:MAG: type I methionyl aminopeptidase [Candidatus Firestonebacteria bacterium]|nr:type I methionyl aminopeptidase [Candidatus Firestonebacteria bacterium]